MKPPHFQSLTLKLTLAFLLVSLSGIAIVALLVGGITATEFNRFLLDRGLDQYTNAVTNYYEENHTWAGIEDILQEMGLHTQPSTGAPDMKSPPSPPFILVDPDGVVIVSSGFFRPGQQINFDKVIQKSAIEVDGQVVGYVITTGGQPRPDPFEARYKEKTNQALILAAVAAVILAVGLGIILARTITRPVLDLTAASTAMAKGQLNQQVKVRSQDELGQLTQAFNKMSVDLERSNQLRRQMTADIAHDLRTPLAVITGYLEGLKDGVIKPSPKRFAAIYDEAIFLQRLVEDLRTLTLADAGELKINLRQTQPGELIEKLSESFQHQADLSQITLISEIEESLPGIKVDPERMQQAMANLVSNALRYTPPGGEIHLAARLEDQEIRLEVKDSGSGISADDLPHIFDRFYRGDESRQEGGSGLGLAIARSLIELQGGTLTAHSDGPGNGSLFTVHIAVAPDAMNAIHHPII
jgi:signal transduction histidine kinase